MAQLAEDLRLHFALSLEDERVIAADSLRDRKAEGGMEGGQREEERERSCVYLEKQVCVLIISSEYISFFSALFVHPTAM